MEHSVKEDKLLETPTKITIQDVNTSTLSKWSNSLNEVNWGVFLTKIQ